MSKKQLFFGPQIKHVDLVTYDIKRKKICVILTFYKGDNWSPNPSRTLFWWQGYNKFLIFINEIFWIQIASLHVRNSILILFIP